MTKNRKQTYYHKRKLKHVGANVTPILFDQLQRYCAEQSEKQFRFISNNEVIAEALTYFLTAKNVLPQTKVETE